MAQQVYVWDRVVRLFHWSLVLLFATSYLTGEEEHWFHVYSGYAIFSLVSLRVLWGLFGSKYARFGNFLYSPGAVVGYLKALVAGSPPRYLGHNPAGGIMVVALLAALYATTLSGMKLYAVEEGKGPFAQQMMLPVSSVAYASDDEDEFEREHEYAGEYEEEDEYSGGYEHEDEHEEEEEEEYWEEIHETSINVLLLLVLIHIAGVIFSCWRHRENLVKAMITGKKDPLED